MSSSTLSITDELSRYLLDVSVREPALLKQLREETKRLPEARMQISPEQGRFMSLIIEMLSARRALEIGTFTGYSALWVAMALPADGELLACDVSEEYTDVAKRYWQRAGVSDRIRLELGDARQTLRRLLDRGARGSYDFAFIDADKTGYDQYYEQSLELLRSGGVIAVDNALWGGSVADDSDLSESTQAIRRLNQKVGEDTRVSSSLIPIGDGLLLARKR